MSKAYVIGTCDTKAIELCFVRDLIHATGVETVLVNVGTKGGEEVADVPASEVEMCHPDGPASVFVNDRGQAVVEISRALRAFILEQADVGGVIGLGGSGGSGIIAPALQALHIGVPKVLVSTLASGDVSAYVGPSDVNMFHPVTDVSGLNRVSRKVLGNAAHAIAGMMTWQPPVAIDTRPPIALSMFGVTTPSVQAITDTLQKDYDCLVFHATGSGGRSMEQLISQGDISGVLDITTTEICDLLVGGVLSAGEERLDSIAQTSVPYVGSCGALDMVNFWGPDSVPDRFSDRLFYYHNAQVTLMRTTEAESAQIGEWVGQKLNACNGPVRFFIPLKGVSALDAEGAPFWDPKADAALFQALEDTVQQTENRQLIKLDHHINDPEFAAAAAAHFQAIATA
ncbi:UPF0261 family protein [Parasedimentitalea maritima]|uniref:UPF0261 family protein n=1 Tax=Parasedimentitalea maritima TaxID=2578117 RepID=A0ABY2USJ5_9RHOB|nr:Tm-1-like ATP-binding domain-containing protein [Zongyanglinia marina]TLP61348.1 UPF0261 family protein [Zongyanglinia marina]